MREATVAGDPEPLIAWFSDLDLPLSRIGLEAGPLSRWLYRGLAKAGFAAELLETRHVRDAFKAMAARAGKNKAKVALARKLAMILHCWLVDGTPFVADKAAMARG